MCVLVGEKGGGVWALCVYVGMGRGVGCVVGLVREGDGGMWG